MTFKCQLKKKMAYKHTLKRTGVCIEQLYIIRELYQSSKEAKCPYINNHSNSQKLLI